MPSRRASRGRPRALLGVLGSAFALLSTTPSAANGRFPTAQQVLEHPGDPDRLWLRATWGFITTSDRGKSWRWICEAAVGYGDGEDPAFAIAGDGRLLAGLFAGLAASSDLGCEWGFPSAALTDRFVVDLSTEPDDPSRTLALISMGQGVGTFLNQIHRSTDNGATWTQVGSDLGTTLVALTLDTAPSLPSRLYVSGVVTQKTDAGSTAQGAILRSDDATTWQTLDIPGSTLQSAPFIAAVDPGDPDTLFVRLNGQLEDALVHTTTGGQSFEELLRGKGELYGFALSPDGSTVLAGFGDPRDGRDVDPAVMGIWRSSTASFAFERVFEHPVSCLKWTAAGVYACAKQNEAGFELGISQDEGESFESLLVLDDVTGPLECAPETDTGRLCPQRLPDLCRQTGICPDGGAADAGGADAAQPATTGAESASGCGCAVPMSGRKPALRVTAFLLSIALAGALRSRRRLSARPLSR
jgi:hypothetical protein